jgi:hypothetical protein
MFTSCGNTCPILRATMSRLDRALARGPCAIARRTVDRVLKKRRRIDEAEVDLSFEGLLSARSPTKFVFVRLAMAFPDDKHDAMRRALDFAD